MKAFIIGLAATIVVAVAAAIILEQLGMSSASVYSTNSVRL